MYRIGEVARQLGVHPDRLRKLEAAGLFTPTRDLASQRRYGAEDIAALRRILYPSAPTSEAGGAALDTAMEARAPRATEARAHGA